MDTQDLTLTLIPIYKLVDDFVHAESETETILPILPSNLRAQVHQYIKNLNLYSESISVKGSENKQIRVIRYSSDLSEKNQIIKKEPANPRKPGNIDFFVKYTRAPFPTVDPAYVDYYIKLFDPLYDTKNMWELYVDEFYKLNIQKESSDTSRKIREVFEKNSEYIELINKKLTGPEIKLRKDVYNLSNVGKYFLSVDIRTANFTVLRNNCPSLFTSEDGTLLSWSEFVNQFTKSKFIQKSKYFRELVFGLTGFMSKAATLQEIYMDSVHNLIVKFFDEQMIPMNLKMKAGDELVYELSDYNILLDQINILIEYIKSNQYVDLHFRIFRIDQIENKSFILKTFIHNTDWVDGTVKTFKQMVEFKTVPKYFMPQIIKWYNKEPIIDADLIFTHEGILAQYKATIFD
jgi:hypothetical protein